MKYILHNLAKDPSFEDISLWTTDTGTVVADTSIKKYDTQSAKVSGTGNEVYITCSTKSMMVQGHNYYARVEGYQSTKGGSTVQIYWPSAEPVFGTQVIGDAGQWNIYSFINTRDDWNGEQSIRVDYDNATSTEPMYFDGLMMIDLTADFPDGNIPSKEELDKIPFFKDSYVYYTNDTFTNLVQNGSFENEITNWQSIGNISATSLNRYNGMYSALMTENSNTSLYQTLAMIYSGHKYYISVYLNSNGLISDSNSQISISQGNNGGFVGISLNNYNFVNKWEKVSDILTMTSETDMSGAVGISLRNESAEVYVDNFMLIDLTEIYGSGNEPTLEWCEHNLPDFFEKTYTLNSVFGIDENTIVMAHFDSDLDDDSLYHQFGYNARGTPTLSTTQTKFGLKTLDATTTTCTAFETDVDVLNGDWTLDWWEYWSGAGSSGYIYIGRTDGADGYGVLLHVIAGQTELGTYASDNGAWNYLSAWNGNLTKVQNQWIHKALVHKNGTLYCFQNGTMTGSTALPNFSIGNNSLFINGRKTITSEYFGGFISEVRLSNVGRWTSDFTPPVNPYWQAPAPYDIKVVQTDDTTLSVSFHVLQKVNAYHFQRMIQNGAWEDNKPLATLTTSEVFRDENPVITMTTIIPDGCEKIQFRIRGDNGAWGYSNICKIKKSMSTLSVIGGRVIPNTHSLNQQVELETVAISTLPDGTDVIVGNDMYGSNVIFKKAMVTYKDVQDGDGNILEPSESINRLTLCRKSAIDVSSVSTTVSADPDSAFDGFYGTEYYTFLETTYKQSLNATLQTIIQSVPLPCLGSTKSGEWVADLFSVFPLKDWEYEDTAYFSTNIMNRLPYESQDSTTQVTIGTRDFCRISAPDFWGYRYIDSAGQIQYESEATVIPEVFNRLQPCFCIPEDTLVTPNGDGTYSLVLSVV